MTQEELDRIKSGDGCFYLDIHDGSTIATGLYCGDQGVLNGVGIKLYINNRGCARINLTVKEASEIVSSLSQLIQMASSVTPEDKADENT